MAKCFVDISELCLAINLITCLELQLFLYLIVIECVVLNKVQCFSSIDVGKI